MQKSWTVVEIGVMRSVKGISPLCWFCWTAKKKIAIRECCYGVRINVNYYSCSRYCRWWCFIFSTSKSETSATVPGCFVHCTLLIKEELQKWQKTHYLHSLVQYRVFSQPETDELCYWDPTIQVSQKKLTLQHFHFLNLVKTQDWNYSSCTLGSDSWQIYCKYVFWCWEKFVYMT